MTGRILRELRENKNITQAQMAEVLEIDRSTYTKYESGKSNPDSTMLKKIADFFHVSVDYLLGRTNDAEKKKDILETKAYHNLDASGLPEEDIRKVEEYIELLKKKYNPDGTLKGNP